jgi:hypothetical protein
MWDRHGTAISPSLYVSQQVPLILRYPHVRLAMLNRLATCGDCETAFRETAQALGFDVSQERRHTDGKECASIQTAYAILQKTAPTRADALFKELSVEIEQYQKQFRGKAQLPMRMRSKDKCEGMGAVVMDFLLQLIEAESCEFVVLADSESLSQSREESIEKSMENSGDQAINPSITQVHVSSL